MLTYLSLHSQVIEADMNKAMKEQNRSRNNTASSHSSSGSSNTVISQITVSTMSSGSTSSTRSTRRRTPEKEPIAAKLMQKHNYEIELRFD